MSKREELSRDAYMATCKHRGMEDICLKQSGYYGGLWYKNQKTGEAGYSGIHMTIACDGKCPRMRRYDKLHKSEK